MMYVLTTGTILIMGGVGQIMPTPPKFESCTPVFTYIAKGQLISKCLYEIRAEIIKFFVGILVQTMIS